MAKAKKIEPEDDAQAPEPAPEPMPAAPPAPETKRVLLLCHHVFLPEDPTQAGWQGSAETRRYDGETDGRRTRLTVHSGLAAFLQDRKQAEILDD